MHYTWLILRSAVVVVYAVGALFAGRRLRGAAKEWNQIILVAMFLLVVIKIALRHYFGGLVYQCAVLIVGLSAVVAALIVVKMVIAQKAGDEAIAADDKDRRTQALKLS
jgi:hypothetical protein